MKLLIQLLFLFILSQTSFGQRLGISLSLESGLLQHNRFEPYRQNYRNNFSLSLSPTLGLEWCLPNSQTKFHLKTQYSFNNIPFAIKGNPLFRDNEGFETIYIKNNHVNMGIDAQQCFLNLKKIKLNGFIGLNFGIPLLVQNSGAYTEGTLYYQDGFFAYRLEYLITRQFTNVSLSAYSGVSMELPLLDIFAFTFGCQYRLGFKQSVIYSYFGDIYTNTQIDPIEDWFSSSFSNSGFFFSTGIKCYLF